MSTSVIDSWDTLPANYAALDAWMKAQGWIGASELSRDAAWALCAHWGAAAQAALSSYVARFGSSTEAFLFNHDAGGWAAHQVQGPRWGDSYFVSPDNRTDPKLTDPDEALARAKAQGIGWDGTVLCDATELPKRLALAESRRHQAYFKKVDPDFLVYATIAGINADGIHWTSSTFSEWLDFQVSHAQDF